MGDEEQRLRGELCMRRPAPCLRLGLARMPHTQTKVKMCQPPLLSLPTANAKFVAAAVPNPPCEFFKLVVWWQERAFAGTVDHTCH